MNADALTEEFVLDRHRLYMLPTPAGWWFAAALFAMWVAAVNYQNSLAYGFAFLLGATALVSMLYTHRNAAGLSIRAGDADPVFAGESAQFPVTLSHDESRDRVGLWLHAADQWQTVEVKARTSVRATVSTNTEQRGYIACPEVRVATSFPFGLLYTWSAPFAAHARCLVYPRPGPRLPLPLSPDRRRFQDSGAQPEGDDFTGLRSYQPSDPPRHVHWKAAARGQGLHTKRFGGAALGTVWLDWEATRGPDIEARLSLLCRWVLDAETEGARYGLQLPGLRLEPDHGPKHRHRCLAALARFENAS
jgi:uncharacterized protein (DUF58 family)